MPKEKRGVGRPAENPFASEESEMDFIRRADAMIKLYFQQGETSQKKDFNFGSGRTMSKTLFWSFIFIYYEHSKDMLYNIQGFLNIVQEHFGANVASDRTSICKKISMLNRLYIQYPEYSNLRGESLKLQERYLPIYKYLIRKWDTCLPS